MSVIGASLTAHQTANDFRCSAVKRFGGAAHAGAASIYEEVNHAKEAMTKAERACARRSFFGI
jgi:hypothetical protein